MKNTGWKRTLNTALSVLLSLSMALSTIPSDALAEAISEAETTSVGAEPQATLQEDSSEGEDAKGQGEAPAEEEAQANREEAPAEEAGAADQAEAAEATEPEPEPQEAPSPAAEADEAAEPAAEADEPAQSPEPADTAAEPEPADAEPADAEPAVAEPADEADEQPESEPADDAEDADDEDGADEESDEDEDDEAVEKAFSFENSSLMVTAVASAEAGLPKGTELRVQPVTDRTAGYDYDAYMGALNRTADEDDTYTDKNTLLYDVAFIAADEDGTPVEIEPAKGTVKVSFRFKQDQLVKKIDAPSAADVTVTHLGLAGGVRDAVALTSDATNLSASDVVVEQLGGANVSAAGTNVVTFEASDFSVYAFSYTVDFHYSVGDEVYQYSLSGGDSITLSELAKALEIYKEATYTENGVERQAFASVEEFLAEVESVEFSDPSLVTVTRKGQDWILKSLQPFTSEETLNITMQNGDVVTVKVTDDQESFVLNVYGFNLGAYYKRYSTTLNSVNYKRIMIGYASDIMGYDDIKGQLTFESVNALEEVPFTFASEGFGLEDQGFVKTEKNTYAGYYYDMVGFVPVVGSEIEGLSTTDAYYNQYVATTEEDAKAIVTRNNGVLYGDKPTKAMLNDLAVKGSVAIVWRQHDPARFTNLASLYKSQPSGSVMPETDTLLRFYMSLTNLQTDSVSGSEIPVKVTLSDGLAFTEDASFTRYSSGAEFTINNIVISPDKKSATFTIPSVTSMGYLYINTNVTATGENANESVTVTTTNAWGQQFTKTMNVPVYRPTITNVYFDAAYNSAKTVFAGGGEQETTLLVYHNNQSSGDTDTRVMITLPDNVTLKSAEAGPSTASKRNTLTDLTYDADANTISYTVPSYRAANSIDAIKVTLEANPLEEGQTEGEKLRLTITGSENGEPLTVTASPTIQVSVPYFEVTLYGVQDAWVDMTSGTNTSSTSTQVKFYGADDYTAFTMHEWTYDEDPIKGVYLTDADGSVMRGPKVTNSNTNKLWTLVGFVPISYQPGTIRSKGAGWDAPYGEFYLDDHDACERLIADRGGVLYGSTPTEEQAQLLAQYLDSSGRAKVICVWYIQEPPKEVYTKYPYTESEEYVEKVHPAAYTTTSNGIEVTIQSNPTHSGNGVHPYNVTFTIPEDYNEEFITLNTEFNEATKVAVSDFQPGDKLQYNIKVIDKSGKYGYLKNSGAVGTIDYYNTNGYTYSTVGEGFEGYKIENADEKPEGPSAKSRITRRGRNFAIQALADVSGVAIDRPTDEKVGEALYAIGYGAVLDEEGKPTAPLDDYKTASGDPDYAKITQELLDDYYLDYLNASYFALDDNKDKDKTTPHYTSLADLSVDDYRAIFNSENGSQVMETNPVLVDAMYYGMYEQTILLSESESGIENYQGTWSWMHDWNAATEGNAYDAVISGQYEANQDEQDDGSVVHNLSWYQWVTGARNGNNMQDTYFGLAYQFKLVKGATFKATKKWLNKNGASAIPDDASATFELLKDGAPTGNIITLDGEVDEDGEKEEWTAVWEGLDIFRKDKDGNLIPTKDGDDYVRIVYSVRENECYPESFEPKADTVVGERPNSSEENQDADYHATISNIYDAAGFFELEIQKQLENGTWPKDESGKLRSATFLLTPQEDGAPMPEDSSNVHITDKGAEVSITEVGDVDFGLIKLSNEHVGNTYHYTVTETSKWSDKDDPYTWAKSGQVDIEVVVSEDSENGIITAEVTNDGESNGVITNTYTSAEPSFEKKIADINDSEDEQVDPADIAEGEWQDSADYDIDDAVPYKLTATLPKDVSAYDTYELTFQDRMESALDFNNDIKVGVTKDGKEIDGYEVKSSVDEDGHGFTYTLTWTDTTTALNGAVVEVLYTATLNEHAFTGYVGNANAARLIYSNNPTNDDEGETDWDYNIVYTYSLSLYKHNNEDEDLEGAKFQLYKFSAVTGDYDEPVGEEVSTDHLGCLSWIGLDDGKYKLVETEAPAEGGYGPITPLKFEVTAEHNPEWQEGHTDGANPVLDTDNNEPGGRWQILEEDNPVATALNGDAMTGELSVIDSEISVDVEDHPLGSLRITKALDGLDEADEEGNRDHAFGVVVINDSDEFVYLDGNQVATMPVADEGIFEILDKDVYERTLPDEYQDAVMDVSVNEPLELDGLPAGYYRVYEVAKNSKGEDTSITSEDTGIGSDYVHLGVSGEPGSDAVLVDEDTAAGYDEDDPEKVATPVSLTNMYSKKEFGALRLKKTIDSSSVKYLEEVASKISFDVYDKDNNLVDSKTLEDMIRESSVQARDGSTETWWTLENLEPGEYTIEEINGTLSADGHDLVNVVADSEGAVVETLKVTVASEGVVEQALTNIYAESVASFRPAVAKTVDGDYDGDEKFKFTLSRWDKHFETDWPMNDEAGEDNLVPGDYPFYSEGVDDSVTVEDFDEAEFGLINYTVGGTYYYVLSEADGGTDGMAYADPVYIKVVVDAQNGVTYFAYDTDSAALEALELADETPAGPDSTDPKEPGRFYEVAVYGSGEAVADPIGVTNFYNPAAGSLTVTKAFEGLGVGDLSTDELEAVTFTVEGADGSYSESRTLAQMADETSWDEPYWLLEGLEPGRYTVTESGAELDGYELEATYEVNGDASGEGGVNVVAGGEAAVTVTNTYTPDNPPTPGPDEHSVSVPIKVEKVVSGDEYTGGEDFSFTLAAENDEAEATLPEAKTVTVRAGKTKSFGRITYTEAGTYAYSVTEAAGSTEGMTYDTSKHYVVVTVEAAEDDSLSAEVRHGASVEDALNGEATTDPVTVDNPYRHPTPGPDSDSTSAEVTVKKVVKATSGKYTGSEKFSFTIAADNEAAKAKLPKTRTVAVKAGETKGFGKVTYTEEGWYRYTVTEAKGKTAGMTYDTYSYHVSVWVREGDNGKLSAAVYHMSNLADALDEKPTNKPLTITNYYTQPKTPGTGRTSTPKTGDPSLVLELQAIAGAGALSVFAGALRRRRRR